MNEWAWQKVDSNGWLFNTGKDRSVSEAIDATASKALHMEMLFEMKKMQADNFKNMCYQTTSSSYAQPMHNSSAAIQ